jgi:hypothetical protein
MTLNTQFTSLMLDTQAVMALRIMGMAGALPHARTENARMMDEKRACDDQSFSGRDKSCDGGQKPGPDHDSGNGPRQ